MDRHFHSGLMCSVVIALALVQVPAARGQQGYPPGSLRPSVQRSDQPDTIVLSAIRANPLTSPYAINATWRNGKVILSGRVGTSVIHDMAVRTVIDLGYPLRDDLVIDTAEAHRVAVAQAVGGPWSSPAGGSLVGSAPYFVYPPPLFGRVDDPLFGFEPPLVSFPPWATSGNPDPRVRQAGLAQVTQPGAPGPGATSFQEARGNAQRQAPPEQAPVKGNLQLTVDMAGQVHLSGVVASELDKQVIEDEARNTPGVSQVFSELRVATQPTSEAPPPPPEPVLRPGMPVRPNPPRPEVIPQPQPQPQPPAPEQPAALAPRPDAEPRKAVTPELAMARDGQRLTRRVADALARRSTLAGLPISVQSRGDVVTLAGKVPSAYEAMLAYRTVEQTPGVREISDQLQFQVPDENHPNPLRQKGRPDDLEPYLTSQIRRHVGELAHVDRVRVRGDSLEIQGTLPNGEDPNRLHAILRSMPLLRDFRLEPVFHPE